MRAVEPRHAVADRRAAVRPKHSAPPERLLASRYYGTGEAFERVIEANVGKPMPGGLEGLQLVEQSDHIKRPIHRCQAPLAGGIQYAAGQCALERRLGRTVPLRVCAHRSSDSQI